MDWKNRTDLCENCDGSSIGVTELAVQLGAAVQRPQVLLDRTRVDADDGFAAGGGKDADACRHYRESSSL